MTPLAELGPVSRLLAERLSARVQADGIVLWFDPAPHYVEFVERTKAHLNHPVRCFRGSFLELMLELAGLADGVDLKPLLVHLPRLEASQMSSTPLLELFLAVQTSVFEPSLAELAAAAAGGEVRADEIARLAARIDEWGTAALARLDAELAARLAAPVTGVAAKLQVMRPTEVIADLLGPDELRRFTLPDDADALWEQLGVWLGLPTRWRDELLPSGDRRAEDVAAVASSWALCVEYVVDLHQRTPTSPRLRDIGALPPAVKANCCEVARWLREHHGVHYRRIADETEALLADEVEHAKPEHLGHIDTFRFEDAKMLEGALTKLEQRRWQPAAEWARRRIADDSPWLRHDPYRLSTWQLVLDAAELGLALARAGDSLTQVGGLAGAVEQYVQHGAAVDKAHRWLEQHRSERLDTQMPEFERLRACLDAMREAWRAWADAWTRTFCAMCRAHGFLPAPSLQQRMLFDEVVRESCRQPGVTALFMVDALRFEMAQELAASLDEPQAVRLDARLAELPTITAVGMNAIAPVAVRGRLRPVVRDAKPVGFRASGEFQVENPAARVRAMHERIGGRKPELFELDALLATERRKLAGKVASQSLIVVHSDEIDAAGESGQGLGVFTRILQKLRGAWHLLRGVGVQRFVFTADHGFLLVDELTAIAQPYKRKVDPKRRYVLERVAAVEYPHEVRVRLAELDYEGDDWQLVMPDTTAVFDTGRRNESFVHGGNSLQERVIPVLRVFHARPAGGILLRHAIEAKAKASHAGLHVIEARVVVVADGALDFGGVHEIELAMRVPGGPDIEVEVASVRDGARLERGVIQALLGRGFDVYFRLRGPTAERVQVEIYHPSYNLDVEPYVIDRRFAVIDTTPVTVGTARESPAAGGPEARGDAHETWLTQLPVSVREFFAHLAKHRIVTASEAERLLGGARALRRFAVEFDQLRERVPFEVRIEVVAGVKRYVREGS